MLPSLFKSKFDQAACMAALMGIFFIPLSVPLSNFLFVAVIFMLLGGRLPEKFTLIFNYKSTWLALLFLFMIGIGMTYSLGSFKYSWHNFIKYGEKLALFMLLIPLFLEVSWRKRAINLLIMAVLIVILLRELSWIETSLPKVLYHKIWVLYVSIEFNILVSFILFVVINKIWNREDKSWGNILIALYLTYYILFINGERSAIIVLFALFALLLLQRFKKGLIFAIILIPCTAFLAYKVSPTIENRILEGRQNIQDYTNKKDHNSPWGVRLYHAEVSLDLIKKHPFWGTGTGSYLVDYTQHTAADKSAPQILFSTPHNNYLMIAVETGLIGLVLFLAWFLFLWLDAKKLPHPEKYLAQGLILTYSLANLFITAFYLHYSGIVFVTLLAVFFAARENQTTDKNFIENK